MANSRPRTILLKIMLWLLLTTGVAAAGADVFAHQALTVDALGEPAPGNLQTGNDPPSQARASSPPSATLIRTDLYGDLLPADALARIGTIRWRHGGPVNALAFTPDGRAIASAASDGAIHFWDPATGKELKCWDHGSPRESIGAAPVESLAFSPDGRAILVSRLNHPPRLQDAASGRVLCEFGGSQQRSRRVAFSPDGKTIAYGNSDDVIHVADAMTGDSICRLEAPGGRLIRFMFSPDGKSLAAGADDARVYLWDATTGKEVRRFAGHGPGGVTAVFFSADGGTIASSGADRTLRLWDTASGKELRVISLPAGETNAYLVLLSPDGKTLISGHAKSIRFWDLSTGKEINHVRFTSNPGNVLALALSPNGKVLASGTGDHEVALWEVPAGKLLTPRAGLRRGLSWVTFSPDGQTLATGGYDQYTRLWETASGRQLQEIRDVGTCVFTPDGRTLLSGSRGGVVRVWEIATGKELRRFKAHKSFVASLALSGDGKTLATSGNTADGDTTVRVWEVDTGRLLGELGAQKGSILQVAFVPGAKAIAAFTGAPIGADQAIRMWDVASGKTIGTFERGAASISSFAVSPDAQILAVSMDRGIRLSAIGTKREFHWLEDQDHADLTGPVAFSPDGRTLISGSQFQRVVRLWEVRTGGERQELLGHQGQITCVAFSPDGTTAASASADGTVLVWDLTGRYSEGQRRAEALTSKALEKLWTDLTDPDAITGYRAMRALVRAHRQAVALVAEHVTPVRPPDAQQIARLLRDLDSPQFGMRQKAVEELGRVRDAAEPALREAMEATRSPEVRRRLEGLLEGLEGPARLKSSRALELLEKIGTSEARELLKSLAAGAPGARPTQEAKSSLDRLAKRKTEFP